MAVPLASSGDMTPELIEQYTHEAGMFFGKEEFRSRDSRHFPQPAEIRLEPGERRLHIEDRVGLVPDDLRGNFRRLQLRRC